MIIDDSTLVHVYDTIVLGLQGHNGFKTFHTKLKDAFQVKRLV